MKFLTVEQVITIHETIIVEKGGLNGIRDIGLLMSALEMPKSAMFGEFLHSTIYDKAAAYLYHIVCNHPFMDGNKRTGMTSALIFLDMNEIDLNLNQTDLEELVVRTSEGKVGKSEISKFFKG